VVKHLEGASLDRIARAANLVGACVAERRGAMPALDERVAEKFHSI
jgi:sugar/nucleoside kinase (ribokinase family)